MFYTYILKSISSGKLYIGQTNNIVKRLERHNTNMSLYTKNKGPYELIYSKKFTTRGEAMIYEKKLKSFKNKKYILEFIKHSP